MQPAMNSARTRYASVHLVRQSAAAARPAASGLNLHFFLSWMTAGLTFSAMLVALPLLEHFEVTHRD